MLQVQDTLLGSRRTKEIYGECESAVMYAYLLGCAEMIIIRR